jgi:hypothetical protein
MRLLNYDETANLLGLGLSTLYSMVSRGQIPMSALTHAWCALTPRCSTRGWMRAGSR